MIARRTLDLLPKVFQTETNKKFLNATMDQLIQEPSMVRMNNFIGRAEGSSVYKEGDSYLQEGNAVSQYYQLEPSLVVRKKVSGTTSEYNVDNVYNYVDLLNRVSSFGGINTDHDRLFSQEYYNYQGFINLEKLINYNQYYWVPNGPGSVNVNAGGLDVESTFSVSREWAQPIDNFNNIILGLPNYKFTGYNTDSNPIITLVRGGVYKFNVNQTGYPFYIQTAPGLIEETDYTQSISRREIKGVINNGEDNGQIIFNVPKRSSQDEFINMSVFDNVDLVIDIPFYKIQNVPVETLLAEYRLDGIRAVNAVKKVIFTDVIDQNWYEPGNFDSSTENGFDVASFDAGPIIDIEKRKGIWQLIIDEDNICRCSYIQNWPSNTKVFVKEGRTYGGRYVYKDSLLDIKTVPNITATTDTLYYQDGVDADIFGVIKLVDPDPASILDVNTIIGSKNYTSPNGIKFTNGLKVKFTQFVEPESYKDNEYIVEGVGSAITLHLWKNFVTPEQYTFDLGSGFDSENENFDTINFDGTFNAPINKEYITISRQSLDGNAWTRGNRWFHKDVLEYTASILTPTVGYPFDENFRGKRPVIEFTPNLKLYNGGKKFLTIVDLIDEVTTDAFSLVEGSSNFFIDGVELNNGMKVVFSKESDAAVVNKVYTVEKINPTGTPGNFQLHLTEDTVAKDGSIIVVRSGISQQGKVYYYDSNSESWKLSQQKTFVNQEPLFDIVNRQKISYGDKDYFPSSNFEGSKLFSYKRNSLSATDSELGFGLTYKTIGNIGDILFENNYDVDVFNYNNNNSDISQKINTGNVLEYFNDSYRVKNAWTNISDKSSQFVERKFVGTLNKRNDFDLNLVYENSLTEKNIFVYLNNKLTTNFILLSNGKSSILRFNENIAVNDKVLVKVYGRPFDSTAIWTVPKNLEKNSLNETFNSITLGQMREHLTEMTRNSLEFRGEPAGLNNLRDIQYNNVGGSIVQHSAPLPYTQLFFNNPSTNIVEAVNYSRREYSRFKERFYSLLETMQFPNVNNSREILDIVMQEITSLADPSQPFYYTDMLAFGKDYIKTIYNVFSLTDRTYNTVQDYDFNASNNYKDILIYVNGDQLIRNKDYTVSGRVLTILNTFALAADDQIEIYEYPSTFGCMVPATPTKQGIYSAYEPRIYEDNTIFDTEIESKLVIQGHDGSITLAFGDFRDQVILEYEKRVYNNIQVDYLYSLPNPEEVAPRAFLQTPYTLAEWTQLLSVTFLEWAGSNNIDIYTNNTVSNDPFSFNYSEATDKLTGALLPGYWRGVYNYYFGTDRPHTHPWEIAGYTIKPDWWEKYYGPAPYTSGNLIMWEDLENGVYYENDVRLIDPPFLRPGLTSVIPVDEHGNLLPPLACLVKSYNSLSASKNWRFGDQSPAETAWRRSSDFPFAVMIAYALARPAEFCTWTFNTKDYVRDDLLDFELNQIINKKNNNRKFSSAITDENEHIPGTNIYLRDRLSSLNLDVKENLVDLLDNIEVHLSYKLSAFTDKKYVNVYAEQSTPQSTNTGVMIPNEDIDIVLTKSAPVARATYSAVIVEKTGAGWTVSGFNVLKPYFVIQPSIINSNNYTVTVGNQRGIIYQDAEESLLQVPYGTTYTTRQQICDFLISYGRYLTSQGFVFDGFLTDQITKADWSLAVKEFLYFTQQGWDESTVISLTPPGATINFNNNISVVDGLENTFNLTRIVDSDNKTLQPKDYRVYRSGTEFNLSLKDQFKGIHLLDIETVQYEHTLIFNNTTVFNDIIYDTILGSRQQRLKLVGRKSKDWNGSLYAPGFLINHKPVELWKPSLDYYKGDIAKHKGKFYTAIKFIPAKNKFDQNDWYEIDGSLLEQKLIPNPALNASQFEDFYNIDTTDINIAADLQSRHATGWQPRNYFNDIGLDSVSQHKFYLGMIKEKGTQSAVNKFLRAKLPYSNNNINLREEWAFKLGDYGNVDNRNFVEVPLNNIKVNDNKILIEFLERNDTRNQIWNTFKPNDLLNVPSTYVKNLFGSTKKIDPKYPTAGYVDTLNVLTTVFDVNKIYNVSTFVPFVGEGSRIWVAADYDNDWAVYRSTNLSGLTATRVIKLSESELEFRCNSIHDLEKNDKVAIKNARVLTQVNTTSSQIVDLSGFFRVTTIVSPTVFRVDVTYLQFPQVDGNINALVFKFDKVRFNSRKDFAEFIPSKGWRETDLVYIDDADDKWQVLENSNKWLYQETQSSETVSAVDNFGSHVELSENERILLVNSAENTGKVYIYGEDSFNAWSVVESIESNDPSASAFSEGLALTNDTIFVGDPEANSSGTVYIYDYNFNGSSPKQIIYDPFVAADARMGASLTASNDNRWLYISAPTAEEVYAYKLINVSAVDTREFTGDGSNAFFDMPSFVLTFGLLAEEIKVYVNDKLLIPYIDYDVYNSSTQVQLVTAPAIGDSVVVEYSDYYLYVDTIANPGNVTNGFGQKIHTSTDGKELIVSAPYADVTNAGKTYSQAGCVYYFVRSVENFISDGNNTIFDTYYSANLANISVDGEFLADNDWSLLSATQVDLNEAAAPSAIVSIETNNFSLIETIVAPELQEFMNYGYDFDLCRNNCSLYVGAPQYNLNTADQGAVYRHVDVARLYGSITGSVTNPTVTNTDIISINNFLVYFTGEDLDSAITDINFAEIPGVSAVKTNDNKIKIVTDSQLVFNRLKISNVFGNALTTLGLQLFPSVQRIDSVYQQDGLRFGERISVASDTTNLLIGTTKADGFVEIAFEQRNTTFDGGTTTYKEVAKRSGAVYLYEYQIGANESENDIGKFAFATRLTKKSYINNESFGNNFAMSRHWAFVSSTNNVYNNVQKGTLDIFNNATGEKTWSVFRQQQDNLDSNKLVRAFIYNKASNILEAELPVVDPSYGKHLPNVLENVNYTSNYDPAVYNNVPSSLSFTYDPKNPWGKDHVGTIWWDTNSVRYLEWNQSDLLNKSRIRHGLYPSSAIDVYQWIESEIPPNEYNALYSQFGLSSLYTVNQVFSNVIEYSDIAEPVSKFYFWVKVNPNQTEFLDNNVNTQNIVSSLRNPIATGTPFVSVIASNAIALYNCAEFIGGDHVLKIEYNKTAETLPIHNEWSLFPDNSVNGIPSEILSKISDSIAKEDANGRLVPDPALKEKQKYGLSNRPRQTVFKDAIEAQKLFVNFVNDIFALYPIRLIRNIDELLNFDPYPIVDEYDEEVADDIELSYLQQDLYLNKTILVKLDSLTGGWTLRKLVNTVNGKEWSVIRTQSYNNSLYWSYADWYAEGYSVGYIPTHQVDFTYEINNLQLKNNDTIKIKNSNSGGFQLIKVDNGNLTLIGQESATIQINESFYNTISAGFGIDTRSFESIGFGSDNTLEVRKIFNAVINIFNQNAGVFVDEFRSYYKQMLQLFIDLITTQFVETDWLFKTSFISIDHEVRNLEQIPVFVKQPEQLVQDYINEIKPYHAKIREYNSRYPGMDTASVNSDDFDLPPFFDSLTGRFRSPQLEDLRDTAIFNEYPYNVWDENYTYEIGAIDIVNGGTGYSNDTRLIIEGGAKARVKVRANGSIYAVIVENPGSGYISSPNVLIEGTGTGAILQVRLQNKKVRSIKTTIKFDRYTRSISIPEYSEGTTYFPDDVFVYDFRPYRVLAAFVGGSVPNLLDIVEFIVRLWEPNTKYSSYDIVQVSWQDELYYEVLNDFTTSNLFETDNLIQYFGPVLDNAVDRTWSYYQPAAGMPGRNLPQLMQGLEYPGVQVYAPEFDKEPGFDRTFFDSELFDAFEINGDGITVLSGSATLDQVISSNFTDLNLGIRPEDMITDGAGFIDVYSSHAPEELVPGRIFDTLDIKVSQLPAGTSDGTNAPQIKIISYSGDTVDTFSFDQNIIGGIEKITVYTKDLGLLAENLNYTVDWVNKTITTTNINVLADDILYILIYGATGEQILESFEVYGDGSSVDFAFDGLKVNNNIQVYVKVNGIETTAYSLETDNEGYYFIRFNSAPAENTFIQVRSFESQDSRKAYSAIKEVNYAVNRGLASVTYPDGYLFTLPETMQYMEPWDSHISVKLNNEELCPANNKYYIGDGSSISYMIPSTSLSDTNTISDNDIVVVVDKQLLQINIDYLIVRDGSSLPVVEFIVPPADNAKIIISDSSIADYRVIDSNTVLLKERLTIGSGANTGLALSDNVTITMFSNHDMYDMRTEVFVGLLNTQVFLAGYDNVGYDSTGYDSDTTITVGTPTYTLSRPVNNLNYLQVFRNGGLLQPYFDYTVYENIRVDLNPILGIQATDVIHVRMFSEEIRKPVIKFRIFKNMIDETEYLGIGANNQTILTENLELTDTVIHVADASKLSEPGITANQPGVIFINGERITYWAKNNNTNTLSQIQRSTGGTGGKMHPVGSVIVDGSKKMTIPQGENLWYSLVNGGQISPDGSTLIVETTGQSLQDANTAAANYLRSISS